MFVVYGTLPIEYYGDLRIQCGGLIAVTTDYTVYEHSCSDSEWLIPGTWEE